MRVAHGAARWLTLATAGNHNFERNDTVLEMLESYNSARQRAAEEEGDTAAAAKIGRPSGNDANGTRATR